MLLRRRIDNGSLTSLHQLLVKAGGRAVKHPYFLAAFFLSLPLLGQSQEITTQDAPITFAVKSNLVLVRVVVRDKAGQALGTLQKQDFQLFDKGKLQVISNFSVEKSTARQETAPPTPKADARRNASVATPSVEPDRFVAYFFDDVHLSMEDIYRAREAAGRHLAESLTANSRAAIYTSSGQVMVDFTDDAAKLKDGLLQLRSHVPTPRAGQCPNLSFYQSDLIQNKNDATALEDAAKEVWACTQAPMPFSGAVVVARQAASRVLSEENASAVSALDTLKDVVRRIAVMRGQRNVVVVSPGFLVTNDNRREEADVIDRAIRSDVILSALDARGLFAMTPVGDAAQTYSSVAKFQFELANATSLGDVLDDFAASTGGVFFHNSNDLEAGFQRVAAAPEYSFLLGFSPQNLKFDGSYHALKITVKGSNTLASVSRRGYFAPTYELSAAQEAAREIEEALASRDELQDLPVSLHTQFFKTTDVNAKLMVLAQLDVKRLQFNKVGELNQKALLLACALFDRNGNSIASVAKTVAMKLKDETLAGRLADAGITIKNTFDVISGTYFIRLVVRDIEGHRMSALNGAIEIP